VIVLQYCGSEVAPVLHQFPYPNTATPPHKNDAIALIMLGCLCGTTAVTHPSSSSGSSSGSAAAAAVGNPAAHTSESKLPVTNGELDALLRRV